MYCPCVLVVGVDAWERSHTPRNEPLELARAPRFAFSLSHYQSRILSCSGSVVLNRIFPSRRSRPFLWLVRVSPCCAVHWQGATRSLNSFAYPPIKVRQTE